MRNEECIRGKCVPSGHFSETENEPRMGGLTEHYDCKGVKRQSNRVDGTVAAQPFHSELSRLRSNLSTVPHSSFLLIHCFPGILNKRHLRQKDLVGHDAPVRLHGLGDLQIVDGQGTAEGDLHLIHV